MTTSLVTGGAGFIGSHVARELVRMGHRVVVLDDLSGGDEDNLEFPFVSSPSFSWVDRAELERSGNHLVTGSICDANLVDFVFAFHRPDYVFHCAAYAAEGLSHFIRHHNYMVNMVGSANVINAAIKYGVKRFVFTSSAAVYGHGNPPFTEEHAPSPIDPYGIAKYAVEMDLRAAQAHFGLPYTIFRLHNVYGPGQNLADPHRNVIALFMRACLASQSLTIFGDGQQKRAWTYIDDVAPYIARCVDGLNGATENQILNIGGSAATTTVNELALLVNEVMGTESPVTYLPVRKEAQEVTVVARTMRRLYGLQPGRETPLREGLEKMAAWARSQPLQEARSDVPIELSIGLPEVWK
jgi:UDP-glucose 4-epimerase